MTRLDLYNLDVLAELRAALGQFTEGAQESLRIAEEEIRRVQEWIEGRVHHWQRQVDNGRRDVTQADMALRRCQASGARDSRGITPDCREAARALAQAQARLRANQENLQLTRQWRERLVQAINDYRQQARRLEDLTTAHTEKGRAYLQKSAFGYETVLAAARTVGLGIAAGASGVGAGVAIMIEGVNKFIGRANLLAGDAAEGIAQQVTADELGLKIVQFDQRKHGFDGIFQGPNGQYILLESKASDDGKLHLAPDSYGHRQASAGWVAAVAQRMATPGSDLYSITNAQIGQAILDSGPANVPMLAVVTDKQTNAVNIYLRAGSEAMSADWLSLSSGNTAQIAGLIP